MLTTLERRGRPFRVAGDRRAQSRPTDTSSQLGVTAGQIA